MLPLILGGAGLGIVKHFASDKPKEERQRRLAAETARYSPWTGMQPQQVQDADIFGNVMQGGLTGASFAQGLQGLGGGAESSMVPRGGGSWSGQMMAPLRGRVGGYIPE